MRHTNPSGDSSHGDAELNERQLEESILGTGFRRGQRLVWDNYSFAYGSGYNKYPHGNRNDYMRDEGRYG